MRNVILPLLLLTGLGFPAAVEAQTSLPRVRAELPEASVPALSPGDIVRITVWRKPELSGEFEIGADGSIRHPLYREIKVAGLPLATAEQRLRTFLEEIERTPQVVLEALFQIAVGGEVRQPNLYTLPPEMSIAQAVARAGGATERGRLDRVRVLRNGSEMVLDLTRPDASAAQVLVRSGDQIIVDRRTSIFRDYITPAATIIGAAAAITSALRRR